MWHIWMIKMGLRCAQFRILDYRFLLSVRAVWVQTNDTAHVCCLKISGLEGESAYRLYPVVGTENTRNLWFRGSLVSGQRKWVWAGRSFANTGHLHSLSALLPSSVPHRKSFKGSNVLVTSGDHRRGHIAKNSCNRFYTFWNDQSGLCRFEEMRSKVKKVVLVYDR